MFGHEMNNYDNKLWTEMTQMEWDFLAHREPNWRANWYKVTPELRDRLKRFNEYQSEGYPVTELSLINASLVSSCYRGTLS